MAMNASAGIRALVATTLLASACPIFAYAGPRDAAPISYDQRVPASQAPLGKPTTAPSGTTYRPANRAMPRLNPVETRDSWRGPVTHTGSGTIPAHRQQISFTYPGSVRPQSSLPATAAAPTAPATSFADSFSGRATVAPAFGASTGMTAGHPSLPLNSLVHVRASDTGREVVVRVTSRTSDADGREITLSPYAGEMLGLSSGQSASVDVDYLGPATGDAGDDFQAQQSAPPSLRPQPDQQTAALPAAQRPAPISDRRQQLAGAASSSGLFVQIGSFTDFDHAASLAGQVTSGFSSDVRTVDLRGTTYHRVMVGPFRSRTDADMARTRLSRQGYRDSFVTQG